MTNVVSFPGLGLKFELNRVAFSVFGHNIYWYGVIIALGFLLAVAYGLWRAPRFSMDPDIIVDAIFVVVPSAIVGARLYYIIFNPDVCFENGSFSLLRAVAFWNGGLAIYGGVIATAVSGLIFAKVRKANFWSGMDITVYGLLIGQMVGRWGNFVNVEAYGSLTTLPWRMCSDSIAYELLYNEHAVITPDESQAIIDRTLGVHPTFLYESLWNLLGFILLVLLAKKGRKFNGQMFLSYVIWYGLGRAAIEGLRTDSLYFFGTGIRSSQLLGIVSAAAAIALYVYRLKNAGPADPPFVKEQSGAAAAVAVETAAEKQSEAVAAASAETAAEKQSETATTASAEDEAEKQNETATTASAEDETETQSETATAAAVAAETEEETEEDDNGGNDS